MTKIKWQIDRFGDFIGLEKDKNGFDYEKFRIQFPPNQDEKAKEHWIKMIKGFTDFYELSNFDEIEACLYLGYFKTDEKFPWEGKILFVGKNYYQVLAEFVRYGTLYKIRKWNLFYDKEEPDETIINDLEGGYRNWGDLIH